MLRRLHCQDVAIKKAVGVVIVCYIRYAVKMLEANIAIHYSYYADGHYASHIAEYGGIIAMMLVTGARR